MMNRPDQISNTQAVVARARSAPLRWPLVAMAVACLCVTLVGCGSEFGAAVGARHPAVGRRLPGLALQALTGDVQDTTLQDLAGKVAVINFWGTWCPPCREEFPEITAFWVQMRDEPDFRFLSVSCGDQDTELGPLRMETIMFLVQKESKLPTYADQGAQTRRYVAMALGQEDFAYPTTIALDQTGVIRGVWIGYDPGIGDKLKALVSELLKKKS